MRATAYPLAPRGLGGEDTHNTVSCLCAIESGDRSKETHGERGDPSWAPDARSRHRGSAVDAGCRRHARRARAAGRRSGVRGRRPCGSCHNYSAGDAQQQRGAGQTDSGQVLRDLPLRTGSRRPTRGSTCAMRGLPRSSRQIINARASHVSSGCGTRSVATAYTAPAPSAGGDHRADRQGLADHRQLGKKAVKISGIAGPAPALAGAKIALKVERKVGTKWTKMKTATATARRRPAPTRGATRPSRRARTA